MTTKQDAWPHIETQADYERFEAAFARGTQGFEIACSVPKYTHTYECDDASCSLGRHTFAVETFDNDPDDAVDCPRCDGKTRLVKLDEEGDYDAGFSWSPCDVCGRPLGRNRQHFALTNPGGHPDCPDCGCVQDGQCLCIPSKPEANPIHYVEACTDCVYYAEYGQLDDMTMLEIEKE